MTRLIPSKTVGKNHVGSLISVFDTISTDRLTELHHHGILRHNVITAVKMFKSKHVATKWSISAKFTWRYIRSSPTKLISGSYRLNKHSRFGNQITFGLKRKLFPILQFLTAFKLINCAL